MKYSPSCHSKSLKTFVRLQNTNEDVLDEILELYHPL